MIYPNTPSNIGNKTTNTINNYLATNSIIDSLKEQQTNSIIDSLKEQNAFDRVSISATTLASNHINLYDATSSFLKEEKKQHEEIRKSLDISKRFSNLF